MAFFPELILLAGALALFIVSLGDGRVRLARNVALGIGLAALVACWISLGREALLFDGVYRVDAFSQWLKLVLAVGYLVVLWLSGDLPDIRPDAKPEYYLLMNVNVIGLMLMVSCVELITLVVVIELASFPLYLMVPLRRERPDQRSQMEAAIKYMMFGIAANGIMLFGISYLFGMTGTTSLPLLRTGLMPVVETPLATVGLTMLWAGLYYKLAVFPFHFWTPDVYEGGANETASLVASLPKLGAAAVLVRFVTLATPEHATLVTVLAVLAVASMFYGNLVALAQKDFKRLLGFSGIAHAGYTLIGFVALDVPGFAAALYYMVGYVFMVLACFLVITRVSRNGANVALDDLAGLHQRSPLLAGTLLVGVFGLAGLPPFAGFMGKFALLKAILARGHLALAILTVINSAIAIYYYLMIIRQAFFRSAEDRPGIQLDRGTHMVCVLLIACVVLLGVLPNSTLTTLADALTGMNIGAVSVPAGL